jgi:hypothetical protein
MTLNSTGLGEGRTSINTKITVDAEAKTIALDKDPVTLPTLAKVKR